MKYFINGHSVREYYAGDVQWVVDEKWSAYSLATLARLCGVSYEYIEMRLCAR